MPVRGGRTRRARQVRIARLPGAEDLALPAPSTPGAAGLDLPAAVDGEMVIEPGARALVPTGFAIAVPPGLEGQVRPRSGLALHHARCASCDQARLRVKPASSEYLRGSRWTHGPGP